MEKKTFSEVHDFNDVLAIIFQLHLLQYSSSKTH